MAKEDKPTRKPFSDSEKEYIRANCLTKSDKEIAEHLNRHHKSIWYYRRSVGIKKGKSKNLSIVEIKEDGGVRKEEIRTIVPSHAMSEHERREFFKTQLSNSLFYKTLKTQFTSDEMEYYLEEWGSLAAQFSDVISTEKRQIDEYIKAEILGNRILRSIKLLEDEINQLAKEIEDFRKKNDVTNDMEAQQRDQTLVLLCQRVVSQVTSISSSYERSVTLRNNILGELNARRKDRAEAIKNSGTTLMGLIEAMREKEVRETQGRHLALVNMAKDQKKDKSRKPRKFINGDINSILLDDKAAHLYENGKPIDAVIEQYSADNILNQDAAEIKSDTIDELQHIAEDVQNLTEENVEEKEDGEE